MRAVMLSDAHLSGLDDPRQGAMVSWLDALRVDHLFILGDLFHHWWGFEHGVLADYAPVCDALRRLRMRGVPLTVVPGNHDFALGPFFHEELEADVRGPHLCVLDGVGYHLAHGDEADHRLGYRMTRATLRSAAFDTFIQRLGPDRGLAVLKRLAGASRTHGGGNPDLLEAQQAWAEQKLAGKAEVVVMGHAHVPGVTQLQQGRLIRLGEWSPERGFLVVEEGIPHLVEPSSTGPVVTAPLA